MYSRGDGGLSKIRSCPICNGTECGKICRAPWSLVGEEKDEKVSVQDNRTQVGIRLQPSRT